MATKLHLKYQNIDISQATYQLTPDTTEHDIVGAHLVSLGTKDISNGVDRVRTVPLTFPNAKAWDPTVLKLYNQLDFEPSVTVPGPGVISSITVSARQCTHNTGYDETFNATNLQGGQNTSINTDCETNYAWIQYVDECGYKFNKYVNLTYSDLNEIVLGGASQRQEITGLTDYYLHIDDSSFPNATDKTAVFFFQVTDISQLELNVEYPVVVANPNEDSYLYVKRISATEVKAGKRCLGHSEDVISSAVSGTCIFQFGISRETDATNPTRYNATVLNANGYGSSGLMYYYDGTSSNYCVGTTLNIGGDMPASAKIYGLKAYYSYESGSSHYVQWQTPQNFKVALPEIDDRLKVVSERAVQNRAITEVIGNLTELYNYTGPPQPKSLVLNVPQNSTSQYMYYYAYTDNNNVVHRSQDLLLTSSATLQDIIPADSTKISFRAIGTNGEHANCTINNLQPGDTSYTINLPAETNIPQVFGWNGAQYIDVPSNYTFNLTDCWKCVFHVVIPDITEFVLDQPYKVMEIDTRAVWLVRPTSDPDNIYSTGLKEIYLSDGSDLRQMTEASEPLKIITFCLYLSGNNFVLPPHCSSYDKIFDSDGFHHSLTGGPGSSTISYIHIGQGLPTSVKVVGLHYENSPLINHGWLGDNYDDIDVNELGYNPYLHVIDSTYGHPYEPSWLVNPTPMPVIANLPSESTTAYTYMVRYNVNGSNTSCPVNSTDASTLIAFGGYLPERVPANASSASISYLGDNGEYNSREVIDISTMPYQFNLISYPTSIHTTGWDCQKYIDLPSNLSLSLDDCWKVNFTVDISDITELLVGQPYVLGQLNSTTNIYLIRDSVQTDYAFINWYDTSATIPTTVNYPTISHGCLRAQVAIDSTGSNPTGSGGSGPISLNVRGIINGLGSGTGGITNITPDSILIGLDLPSSVTISGLYYETSSTHHLWVFDRANYTPASPLSYNPYIFERGDSQYITDMDSTWLHT